MKRLLSCEFNMDTACVELKFANGSSNSTLSSVSAVSFFNIPATARFASCRISFLFAASVSLERSAS